MAPKELAAFRLPPKLLEDLRTIKDRDGISVTDQVHRALDAWVAERLPAGAKPDRKRAATRKRS